ncbi:MAG: nucleotidyltransferase family protein [Xanthobacteraceae bacterium]|nr:nucleotidyltransferase family protein [Xanthobacteraceae bacterium]
MSRAIAFRFLCGCLSQGLTDPRRAELREIAQSQAFDWTTFVELASRQLVAPGLLAMAGDNGLGDVLPGDVTDYFDGMATLNRQRNEAILAEIGGLGSVLNAVSVVPVVMKGGAHLVSSLYADPGHRVMLDLDLLVSADRIDDCAAALRSLGYEALWDNGYPAHHHYPPLGRNGGPVSVELHAAALDDPFSRLLPADEMFRSASAMQVRGARVAVPSPQARVIQAVAHAQLSNHGYLYGEIALRELLDVARLSRTHRDELDWDEIRDRFAAARATVALGYHVGAANALLGLPVPSQMQTNAMARAFLAAAVWQASHPHVLDIRTRLLRPGLQVRRALSRRALRRRLLDNLGEPAWYRRHWSALIGRGRP